MFQGIRLNVPYSEKDQAKALGARWDAEGRTWYIPAHLGTDGFERWLPSGKTDTPQPNVVAPFFYVMDSWQMCWKCANRTGVAGIVLPPESLTLEEDDEGREVWEKAGMELIPSFITWMNPEAAAEVSGTRSHFRYSYSRTTQSEYWANLCTYCNALQGDFHLHSEPGGAFGFMTKEKRDRIRLSRADVRFEAHALDVGYRL